METLICKCCGEEKAKEDFYLDKKSPNGRLRQPCKDCIREQGKKKRAEYKNNINMPEEKECNTCHKVLPKDMFHKRSDTPSGLSHECKECAKVTRHKHYLNNVDKTYEQVKTYRRNNPEKPRQWNKKWREEHYEQHIEAQRLYREHNRDSINLKSRERRRNPKVKAKLKRQHEDWLNKGDNRAKKYARRREWGKRNRDKICYYSTSRRSKLINATPIWADQEVIKSFYTEAQYFNCEVDHIIPLTHPLVCGLHCEFNMQILTRSENASKNNKFEICEHEVPEYCKEI